MPAEVNKPRRMANSGGTPVHFNGTAAASPATTTIEFVVENEKRITTGLLIQNIDVTNGLEVILDGGASGYVLGQGSEPFYIPCEVSEIDLSGVGGTADYQIIATF